MSKMATLDVDWVLDNCAFGKQAQASLAAAHTSAQSKWSPEDPQWRLQLASLEGERSRLRAELMTHVKHACHEVGKAKALGIVIDRGAVLAQAPEVIDISADVVAWLDHKLAR
jgi:Skp family chaperone for outer membrane proteins